MRLVLLTQDDPFYLAENIDYMLQHLPQGCEMVGCVLFSVSPFGKRENFFTKAWKTYRIFGMWFFLHYSAAFFAAKLNPKKKLRNVLAKHQVPCLELTQGINHSDSLAQIDSLKPDLLISIAGNQIFKRPLLELATHGCINLHTALLPKYRGLMPSFWVLKNQEVETGVSVFLVDEGIDSGPIVVQERIPIAKGMTQQELILKSKKLGMDAVNQAIQCFRDCEVHFIPNPDEERTYFSFPTREDVKAFRRAGGRFF